MTAFTVVHVRFPLLRNTLNNSHRHRIGLFRTAKDDESLPSVVEEKEPLEVVRSPPKQMSEEGKAPENWDDDFLFQTTTSDDPRAAGANHVDTFKEPRGLRDSIAWDDDEDEPPLKQNTLLAGKAPAVVDDDVNWGDSDDEDDRQLPFTPEKQPRQTSSSHNASSLEPSPQKWSDIDDQSDAVDDFSQTPSHLNDVDRTITLKTRYQPPNSALSSSSSLHSHSQIHFPPPRTGTSPIPYSPSSPTMSAFSIGQSSTAHLQLRPTTSDRSSSVGAAPIVPPPRSRRRLKKKTRPANAPGVSDIFEMEDVRGFREELEEYSMTPATHLPAHSTASLQQQQQQQQHQQQQLEGMGLHYLQQDQDSAPSSLSHLPMSDTEIDRVHQDTSMHSNPSSHSASRTPIFSQIGLMKKWSSKRRSRSNSQTNPPTAGLMEPPSRPMSPKTPEPQRPTSPRPWMFRAASTTPPSTSDNPPPVTSLKRRGSSSQRSQTSVKKNPISKVFGFSTSSSNPPVASTSKVGSSRRPMSMQPQARNVPSGPSSGRQPASIGRSVSNPYTESLAPSSLMERPSLLGLRSISGSSLRSKHKREESQESGSQLGAEYTIIPPLPPVPTSVQTDSGSQPPPSTERSSTSSRIPDLPPVLPEPALLPPIELSPPSPPRLVTSASQPLTKKSSYLLQHASGFASSSNRSPGYSASLGRANGSNFVAGISSGIGVSSGSMRRNSLGDLKIPARISKAQSGLRNNMVMVKEFAGNVEQLKTLQTAYQNLTCDIKRILESQPIPKKETGPRRSSNASSLPPGAAPPRISDRYQLAGQEIVKIEEKYALWWECAELLIELGSTPPEKKGEDDPEPAVAEEPSDQPVTDNGPGQVLDIKHTSVGAEGERTPTIPPEPTSPPFTPGKARERAITLAGTESEKEAASAIGGLGLGPGSASTTNVSGKGPPPANRPKWRASTGRHDLNNRQLALLKEMLSNPNPSALFSPPANPKHKQLSMPHYQPSPIAEAPPSNFNGSSDALSPEEPKGKETHPPISHHHFFHRRIHPATASAVTLPSSLSSASPHLPVTHMLPSTSDLTHNPSASPVPTKKARRASRVALTGIRDILRSLKKSATSSPPPVPALPQPSQSPVVEKAVVQTSSPPSVANTSSVPSSRPFTPAAGAVFSPDSSSHDIPNKKTSIRGSSALHSATVSNYPYSSQSAKKSPKRPSLASIFRIGSSKTRKQGGVTPSAGTQSGHVSSAADTTTEDEDYSDWDRMDSVSDIDVTAGNPALDNEHANASNVPTVKRKRPSSRTRSIVPSSFSPPPSAPGSSAQSAPYSAASASQSSLSLTTSPRRMPLTIAEDTSKPLPINPHGSRRRVSSKGAGGANGRIPPTASLPSLSSHFPPSSSSTRLPQLSHQTDPPTTGTPLAPATPLPDIKLALTPENIRPLLEYTREVLFRLNECMVTLEGVNNTVRAAEAGRRSVESGAH